MIGSQVPPVIAGSMAALCSGKCELQLSNEVAPDWTFIGFVYVHYLNAEDMTVSSLYANLINTIDAHIALRQ